MSSLVAQHPIPAARAILLYPRDDHEPTHATVVDAVRWLDSHGVKVYLPAGVFRPQAADSLGKLELIAEDCMPPDVDLAFALGGDGTLLRASRWVAQHQIPVVGANLGDLGFLSAYSRDSLYQGFLDAVEGSLYWEPRLRMRVKLVRDRQIVVDDCASNDINVKHGAIPRLVRLATFIGGDYMATYRADGLVVCTPLGSTAYNLAAGGPILEPGLNAFTITPLCPHSLTHRPVVSSASVEIRISFRGPHDAEAAFLTIDGQSSHELRLGDEIVLRAADEPLRLVPPRANVFQVLASKMGWSDAGVNASKSES